ncbi:hypothetical protein D3C81_334750 [compost metagenome]
MSIESVTDNVYLLGGKIRDQYGEHCCLHVHAQELAEYMNQFAGKMVTMRYWVNDRELTSVEHATELTLEQVMGAGAVSASCTHHWSEVTGYLYTTENAQVGGHDLIAELESWVGKYLLLEITVHDESPTLEQLTETAKKITRDTPATDALLHFLTARN